MALSDTHQASIHYVQPWANSIWSKTVNCTFPTKNKISAPGAPAQGQGARTGIKQARRGLETCWKAVVSPWVRGLASPLSGTTGRAEGISNLISASATLGRGSSCRAGSRPSRRGLEACVEPAWVAGMGLLGGLGGVEGSCSHGTFLHPGPDLGALGPRAGRRGQGRQQAL